MTEKEEPEDLDKAYEELQEKIENFRKKAKQAGRNDLAATRITITPGSLDIDALKQLYQEKAKLYQEKVIKGPTDTPVWFRPTPRPSHDICDKRQVWFDTDIHYREGLPQKLDVSADRRATCIGIGNAYGTGKTHCALAAVEATCQKESMLRVAYASFSNGWYNSTVHASLKDPEKNVGLWLFAAQHATRLNQDTGEIECCPELFKEICVYYLTHEGDFDFLKINGPYPDLIVVFDEVQEFSYTNLDLFVTTIISTRTRLSLIVGAFNAMFSFPSGVRMKDSGFRPLNTKEVTELFIKYVGLFIDEKEQESSTYHEGINLPKLLNGSIRPFTSFGPNFRRIWAGKDPITTLRRRYKETYQRSNVPGILFRAAISGLPCSVEIIRSVFASSSLSLGAVMIQPENDPDYCKVAIAPFQLSCKYELADATDDAKDAVVKTLENFVDPSWDHFEALTAVGPALRLTALSHAKEMFWRLDRSPLQLVFESKAQTMAAKKILGFELQSNLNVHHISGGLIFRNDFDFEECAAQHPNQIIIIAGKRDISAPIDNFLIVPVHDGGRKAKTLVIGIDSKFSTDKTIKIEWYDDIVKKIENWREFKFPKGWITLLVIATSRDVSENIITKTSDVGTPEGLGQTRKPVHEKKTDNNKLSKEDKSKIIAERAARLAKDKEINANDKDLAMVVSNNLTALFGPCLVPARYVKDEIKHKEKKKKDDDGKKPINWKDWIDDDDDFEDE